MSYRPAARAATPRVNRIPASIADARVGNAIDSAARLSEVGLLVVAPQGGEHRHGGLRTDAPEGLADVVRQPRGLSAAGTATDQSIEWIAVHA